MYFIIVNSFTRLPKDVYQLIKIVFFFKTNDKFYNKLVKTFHVVEDYVCDDKLLLSTKLSSMVPFSLRLSMPCIHSILPTLILKPPRMPCPFQELLKRSYLGLYRFLPYQPHSQ